MSTDAAQELARRHAARQAQLARQAAAAAAQQWNSGLDPGDLAGSFAGQVAPRVIAATTAAQLQAAQAGAAYVPAATTAQGAVPEAAAVVAAEALAGIASDGRPLASLLSAPYRLLRRLLDSGGTLEGASAQAQRNLMMIVGTQVADAGRVAAGVGIVADRALAGYERVVTLPACGRCIILAGRAYPHSTGFQRHPRCDCQMIPVTHQEWRGERPGNTPERLAAAMSDAQRRKAFGVAGAKALEHGADIGQVVNARRGMTTAGGRAFTSEGTTSRGLAGKRLGRLSKQPGSRYRRSQVPRVMPEEIYKAAGDDREAAIRLLERFGYIT